MFTLGRGLTGTSVTVGDSSARTEVCSIYHGAICSMDLQRKCSGHFGGTIVTSVGERAYGVYSFK